MTRQWLVLIVAVIAGTAVALIASPPASTAAQSVYVQAALNLEDARPCIPVEGRQTCDATRQALWNGDAQAWAARGVTGRDDVFVQTVALRVNAGDPVAIRNIARTLGWPYLQITHLRFAGSAEGQADEFVAITNLGGGAQDVTGWTMRSPARDAVVTLPSGLVLTAGQSCRVYTGVVRPDSCGQTSFSETNVWPDAAGVAVLFANPLNLLADETRYSADPNNQPPPPNLQGTVRQKDEGMADGTLADAIRAYIERQIAEGGWQDAPYVGECGTAELPEDVGKYCSETRPPDRPDERVEVAIGMTFSEFIVRVVFARRDGAWQVVEERSPGQSAAGP